MSIRDNCGIFGIYAPAHEDELYDIMKIAMLTQQHRGQEGCGMVMLQTPHNNIYEKRGIGLASNVFDAETCQKGYAGIAHCRYSTVGHDNPNNLQPCILHTLQGKFAIAENGNLTHYKQLRDRTLRNGVGLHLDSDIEIISQILSENPTDSWIERISNFMDIAVAAYSLAILTESGLYACRDRHGFRPLFLGSIDGEYMVSSETCVFDVTGGKLEREVDPGEIICINGDGITSHKPTIDLPKESFCAFEYIYLSRPDSYIKGQSVYDIRKRLGALLADECPADADVVIGVPDSSLPAAKGFSQQSGIPYDDGFIKNRYIHRTFIQPTQTQRKRGVSMKLNPLRANINDKRVVIVDDSIVRGNTIKHLVELLWKNGAKEIHVRSASPPVKHPCYMGIDITGNLIASDMSIDEICKEINATSLGYLSYEGMKSVFGGCAACFTGEYPVDDIIDIKDIEDII